MAGHRSAGFHLEIAHILFIDTVGYSKLLTREQHELQGNLSKIIRTTPCFQMAEAEGKLTRLPTGDGMALVFTDSPESPIVCALEICQAIRDLPQLRLRMGIHSGPVTHVVDVNDRSNVAGAAMNMAERVMSCADANHILLSKRAADDLAEYDRWRPYLHDLGECEVKHGKRLNVVNFFTEEFGNPAPPAKFEGRRKHLGWHGAQNRFRSASQVLGGLLLAAVLAGFYFFYRHPNQSPSKAAPFPRTEKSIAVLPFENLSDEKENAYFTDGVQDEILTDLAKVANLKVISRTSVMQYRSGKKRNLREIGEELGVAYLLEGSAQRDRHRVRVSAQLIDARTDNHLWAEHYDRNLSDLFALQSELAETIVTQLEAKISPAERAAIEEQPTTDLTAHDLYVRAKTLISAPLFNVQGAKNLFEAVRLLDEAVAHDPDYFLAYCKLASAHDQIFFTGPDHTPARLALAEAALHNAQRLRPDAGETHLALADHLYCGFLAYDDARRELETASRSLPNEPLIFQMTGFIDRRQGRWEASTRNFVHASELDPHDTYTLQQMAVSYQLLRRFGDAAASLDRARKILPNDTGLQVIQAGIALHQRADPRPLHETIYRILAKNPQAAPGFADEWFFLALCERDGVAADRAIGAMNAHGYNNEGIVFPRPWCQGLAARVRGDAAAARTAFSAARKEVEQALRDEPNASQSLCVLGMIDAALGRKEDALREGLQAVNQLPIKKDAINGPLVSESLAVIYAWTGEKEAAFQQLEAVVRIPSEVSYGQLRLHPFWDSLRGDPRFEKIVASLAPTPEKH